MPLPFGQPRTKSTSPCAGTATHGPATAMQRGIPLHSLAAPAPAGSGGERERREGGEEQHPQRRHTSLRNQKAESPAASRIRTSAAIVSTTVISRNCRL